MKLLFTSPRERRLWLLTLGVVIAIWSTLGLAGTIVGALGEGGLLGAAFGLGVVLVWASVATHGLRRRPGRAEAGVAVGVIATYLLTFVRMSNPAERTHLIEYSVVALLVHAAIVERREAGGTVRHPALVAALITAALGAVDEGIQYFLPSRVFDVRDLLFNAAAGAMAVGGVAILGWARRHRPCKSH